MPTLLQGAVDIAVSEYVPTRSGVGMWLPPEQIARSALLPDVGEFINLGTDRLMRVVATMVDYSGPQTRLVIYCQKVKQPNPP